MRIIVLALFCLSLSLAAFAQGEVERLENKIYQQSKNKNLSQQEKFSSLKELSRELNAYAPSFHQQVIVDIKKGKPLHGQQLTILHKLVSCYVSLSYQFEKLANKTINNPSLKLLSDLERIQLFNITYAPYYINKKFRRLVNAADSSYQVARKELKRQIKKLISKENIKKVNKELKKEGHSDEIQNHPAFELAQDKKKFKSFRKKLFRKNFSDTISRALQVTTHHISGFVGNGAGAVRWRKGYLLNNQKILDEIYSQLQPLDVITEKTRFALTDTLIPGHFGHNAIWLGTKEQLQEINMWEHPSIIPIQKDIEVGRSIIETDRSGTHLKSLEDFMNVDEFGLLRLNGGAFTQERMEEIYKVAIAQLGKTYDFNFDVETTDKLVCSELLYQSFGDINWPTEDYIGRTTISPDNVTSLALFQGTPFQLMYYISGEKNRVDYKNLDDLANDIGFAKIDGVYKQPREVCHYETKRRIGPRRRGTRSGRNEMRVKKCHTEYNDLIYEGHRTLEDFH